MTGIRRRAVPSFLLRWMWDNLTAIAKAKEDHARVAVGEFPRTVRGRVRLNTYRCQPRIMLTEEALSEFWTWLYIDTPFKGHWTTLSKGAGLEGDVFVFTLPEDAMLMRLRWGGSADV